MSERKSCFDCEFCKKIYAYESGINLGVALIRCKRDDSQPMQWTNHMCSFHTPKKEGKENGKD